MFLEAQAGWRLSSRKGRKAPKGIVVRRLGFDSRMPMRWSKFKNKDARYIFDVVSKYAFPAIKKMKYGKLPDFDENGELVEIADRDDSGRKQTSFTRYMDSAVFVIPNPQILQSLI